jgi:hypothetical protein
MDGHVSLLHVFVTYIQSVSGEKFYILGGHSTTQSQQKKLYMYMCHIPNGFRDRAISLYSSRIVDKKEILHTVCNTGIYCSSDKVGTVYLRKFHRQHQCTLQLVWGHGVLLDCTVYSEIALSRKPFGIEHMYFYTFLLRMTGTMSSSWDALHVNE